MPLRHILTKESIKGIFQLIIVLKYCEIRSLFTIEIPVENLIDSFMKTFCILVTENFTTHRHRREEKEGNRIVKEIKRKLKN